MQQSRLPIRPGSLALFRYKGDSTLSCNLVLSESDATDPKTYTVLKSAAYLGSRWNVVHTNLGNSQVFVTDYSHPFYSRVAVIL
jgi:hypothetical protein